MAWQLIYTSAPRSLEAGRSGFGTVARHRAISPLLVSAIERVSQFSRLPGTDAGRVIFSHRIVAVAGGRFHVLSAIRDAGADYTGRTNHLAHHLIADPREIAQLGAAGASPADVLLAMRWASSWDEPPRYFEAAEEIKLVAIPPQPNGSAWQQVTGNPASAWLLASGDAVRGAYVIQPDGTDLRSIFAGSLRLIPERLWQISFTTSLQPSDEPADFRWIGIEERSPLRAQTETSGRPVFDLTKPASLPSPALPAAASPRQESRPIQTVSESSPPRGSTVTASEPVREGRWAASKTGISESGSPVSAKRRSTGRLVLGLIVILVLLAGSGATFFFVHRNIQKERNDLSARLDQLGLGDDEQLRGTVAKSSKAERAVLRQLISKAEAAEDVKELQTTANLANLQHAFDTFRTRQERGRIADAKTQAIVVTSETEPLLHVEHVPKLSGNVPSRKPETANVTSAPLTQEDAGLSSKQGPNPSRAPIYFLSGKESLANFPIKELGPKQRFFLMPGINKNEVALSDAGNNRQLRRADKLTDSPYFELDEEHRIIRPTTGADSLTEAFRLSAKDTEDVVVFQVWICAGSGKPIFSQHAAGLSRSRDMLELNSATLGLSGRPMNPLKLSLPVEFSVPGKGNEPVAIEDWKVSLAAQHEELKRLSGVASDKVQALEADSRKHAVDLVAPFREKKTIILGVVKAEIDNWAADENTKIGRAKVDDKTRNERRKKISDERNEKEKHRAKDMEDESSQLVQQLGGCMVALAREANFHGTFLSSGEDLHKLAPKNEAELRHGLLVAKDAIGTARSNLAANEERFAPSLGALQEMIRILLPETDESKKKRENKEAADKVTLEIKRTELEKLTHHPLLAEHSSPVICRLIAIADSRQIPLMDIELSW